MLNKNASSLIVFVESLAFLVMKRIFNEGRYYIRPKKGRCEESFYVIGWDLQRPFSDSVALLLAPASLLPTSPTLSSEFRPSVVGNSSKG